MTALGMSTGTGRVLALVMASLGLACGPRMGEGGTLQGTVEGPGPWVSGEVTSLAFTVEADAGDGAIAVQCSLLDAGDGTTVYAVEGRSDQVQRGISFALQLEGYVGPDGYYRDKDAEVPGLDLTVETDVQTYDFTTESGGWCDIEVLAGELSGTFDCHDLWE